MSWWRRRWWSYDDEMNSSSGNFCCSLWTFVEWWNGVSGASNEVTASHSWVNLEMNFSDSFSSFLRWILRRFVNTSEFCRALFVSFYYVEQLNLYFLYNRKMIKVHNWNIIVIEFLVIFLFLSKDSCCVVDNFLYIL